MILQRPTGVTATQALPPVHSECKVFSETKIKARVILLFGQGNFLLANQLLDALRAVRLGTKHRP